jgi:hypothetical protein
MTENEWVEGTDPQKMLEFLLGKASDRHYRLFACACCRVIWPCLTDDRSRCAVATAESCADGLASEEELEVAWAAAQQVEHSFAAQAAVAASFPNLSRRPGIGSPMADEGCPAGAACSALYASRLVVAFEARLTEVFLPRVSSTLQCQLLRDIFANPFRPVAINTTWLTPTVTSLARATYEQRALPSGELDPTRLAVLADALEEAGCTKVDVLAHCRMSSYHVRGCWAVDLFLAKSLLTASNSG